MSLRSAIGTFRGHREFHLDFIGRRRVWFLISGLLILLSVGGFLFNGLNLGIDFRGGTQLVYDNPAAASTEEIRQTMAGFGHGDAVVQVVDGREITVRTGDLGEERAEVTRALAEQAGIDAGQVNAQVIGPRWGEQISRKALQGLIIFLVVVSIYIAMRFEWKMSAAAITALFHDLLITTGIYALVGREVTPETVIAILTILGYSLYDTVVIFDKIRENAASPALVAKETYAGAVNLSLNQVFMRSVNTSITTLVPIGALLLFGGDTLQNFAFALFVGVALGAYSSIFVAAPLLTTLKEREPRFAQLRDRARTRRPQLAAVPAAADGPSTAPEEDEAPRPSRPSPRPAPAAAGTPKPRRPKKKSRAKRKKR